MPAQIGSIKPPFDAGILSQDTRERKLILAGLAGQPHNNIKYTTSRDEMQIGGWGVYFCSLTPGGTPGPDPHHVHAQRDSLVFQGLVDWEFQGLVGLVEQGFQVFLDSVVSVQADSLVFQGLVDWEFQGLVGLAVLELVDLVGFLVLVDFLGQVVLLLWV